MGSLFFSKNNPRRRHASRERAKAQANLRHLHQGYAQCKKMMGSNDIRCITLAQKIALATEAQRVGGPEFSGLGSEYGDYGSLVKKAKKAAKKAVRKSKKRQATRKATRRSVAKAVIRGSQARASTRQATRRSVASKVLGLNQKTRRRSKSPARTLKAQKQIRLQQRRMDAMRRRGTVGMQLVGASSTYPSYPESAGMSSQSESGAYTAPMDYDTSAQSDYDLSTSSPSEAYDVEAGYAPESYASEADVYAAEGGAGEEFEASGYEDEDDYNEEDEGTPTWMLAAGAAAALGGVWFLFLRRKPVRVTVR